MTLRVLGCCVLLASFGLAACSDGERLSPETTMAQGASDPDAIPAFEFDPTWPKTPLPNNWILGDMAGLHVDDQDQIWVLHRGNTVPLGSGDNNLARGGGDCLSARPVLHRLRRGRQRGQSLGWNGPGDVRDRGRDVRHLGGRRSNGPPTVTTGRASMASSSIT